MFWYSLETPETRYDIYGVLIYSANASVFRRVELQGSTRAALLFGHQLDPFCVGRDCPVAINATDSSISPFPLMCVCECVCRPAPTTSRLKGGSIFCTNTLACSSLLWMATSAPLFQQLTQKQSGVSAVTLVIWRF